jgi:hypothetical protein
MDVKEIDIFKIFIANDRAYQTCASLPHSYEEVKRLLDCDSFTHDQLRCLQNCWKKYKRLKGKKLKTDDILSAADKERGINRR